MMDKVVKRDGVVITKIVKKPAKKRKAVKADTTSGVPLETIESKKE